MSAKWRTGIRTERGSPVFHCSSLRHYLLCCNDRLDPRVPSGPTVMTYRHVPKIKTVKRVLCFSNPCIHDLDNIHKIVKNKERRDSSCLVWFNRNIPKTRSLVISYASFNSSRNPTRHGILSNIARLVSVRDERSLLTMPPIPSPIQMTLQGQN